MHRSLTHIHQQNQTIKIDLQLHRTPIGTLLWSNEVSNAAQMLYIEFVLREPRHSQHFI